MAARLSTAARNAACNGAVDLVDAGPSPGTIDVRTGAQPASADDPATGTLLATFTLADPGFGDATVGVSTLDTSPALSATGVAAGAAGWFRMKDSTGASVLDGSVTATGGGGELELSSTAVTVGLTVQVTSGTVTMPAG